MKKSHKIAVFGAVCTLSIAALLSGCASNKNLEGKSMKSASIVTKEAQSLGMEQLGNARELGGYKTMDGRTVKRGVLLRTAKPSGASPADLEKLSDKYNLGVFIDFRMGFERELSPNPPLRNVNDVWCPIIDEDSYRANVSVNDYVNAKTVLDRLKIAVEKGIVSDKMYVNFLSMPQGKKGYTEFFRQLVALPEGKSLLFHCTQGKDRTGLGAMLILTVLGVDEDTIMQDFMLTNEFNAELIEKERKMLQGFNLSDEEMALYLSAMDQVNPKYMQNALTYLKTEYGSVLGYITKELGVSNSDIEILQKKFLVN